MSRHTEFGGLLLGLALGWAGCDGSKPEPSETEPPDPTPLEISAVLSAEIPTVITVTWRTEGDTPGHVEFGPQGALDRATPEDGGGTEHVAVLVGLPQETEVSWRVVSGDAVGETGTIRTGLLSGDLPVPVVEGTNDRFLALPILGETSNRPALFDPQGRIVWAYTDPNALSVFRVRATYDGRGIVYSSAIYRGGPAPDSALIRVSWDGTVSQRIDVPDLAHDFVELPDGTLVSLAYEFRDGIEGNKLVSVAPDGGVTDLWSVWDCFDPDLHPSSDPDHGWSHANTLDYDPVEDLLLVGMRNLSTIVAVERATGACRWSFGQYGDVDVSGTEFVHQHQFQHLPGKLLVFDNDGASGLESRVVEYAFDEAGRTASEARTLRADPPLYSFILGDVHRLDDGDTLIAWAVPGTVDRVGADDGRRWRMELGTGNLVGFFQVLADPYTVE